MVKSIMQLLNIFRLRHLACTTNTKQVLMRAFLEMIEILRSKTAAYYWEQASCIRKMIFKSQEPTNTIH